MDQPIIKKPVRIGNSKGFIIEQKNIKLDLKKDYVIDIEEALISEKLNGGNKHESTNNRL